MRAGWLVWDLAKAGVTVPFEPVREAWAKELDRPDRDNDSIRALQLALDVVRDQAGTARKAGAT
jgi:hypothetical protein